MLPLNTTRENKLHWAQEPQLKVAKGCQPVTATQDDALLYSFLLPWMRKQLGGKSPLKTTKVKDSVRNLLLKKCDQFRTGNKYLPFLKIPLALFFEPTWHECYPVSKHIRSPAFFIPQYNPQ